MTKKMRIDKYLALQGLGTRSEVRALLRGGHVQVDGQAARDPGMAIEPKTAVVLLDGAPLVYRAALHAMLNKPAGVLTAATDGRHTTVMDLLPRYFTAMECMPVGRLDLDTEGLLLLTTDGALAHRLLSPKRHVDKVYAATVDIPLVEADIAAFAQGLALSDFTALPAKLEILTDTTQALVTVQEGKYHQVKRMFQARGKQVTHLKRIAFGPLTLDDALAPGDWRELTDTEYTALVKAAGGASHE